MLGWGIVWFCKYGFHKCLIWQIFGLVLYMFRMANVGLGLAYVGLFLESVGFG